MFDRRQPCQFRWCLLEGGIRYCILLSHADEAFAGQTDPRFRTERLSFIFD